MYFSAYNTHHATRNTSHVKRIYTRYLILQMLIPYFPGAVVGFGSNKAAVASYVGVYKFEVW
jgi:hypothetical protein